MNVRHLEARERRIAAAEHAASRPLPDHVSNGDEQRLRDSSGRPTYAAVFTKCLPHGPDGFLLDPTDFSEWVRSIGTGDACDIRRIRIGPGPFEPGGDLVRDADGPVLDWAATYDEPPGVRAWESQGAGLTFDLEGPDAQSVTMPPHPSIDSQELIAEMAEVYWMARCRDVAFADWATSDRIDDARRSLARLWWFRADRSDRLDGATDDLVSSLARRRVLSADGVEPVPMRRLFRGVGTGDDVGPYVSQFLLIGNRGVSAGDDAHSIHDGMVSYGAMRMDQRVRVARPGVDHMTTWDEFLDVQNGADTRGRDVHDPGHRFVATPRDLATYVHHDALYQAYLNACLVLFGLGAPADPGLPFLLPDAVDKQQGFAQFGGPHVLTLVTEVATRALKAVRFQKFNVHRRLRPEALAGWVHQRRNAGPEVVERLAALEAMELAFEGSSGLGAELDGWFGDDHRLLPMAFPEGSPTHPSYGAGHAAVAGACVTVLKAWFDHGWPLQDGGSPFAYEADPTGAALVDRSGDLDRPLTVEAELNKLAANIAIGRNWAGVHYFTDYLESFRLGEQIALGVLEEQKPTYGEAFSLTVPLLDGTSVQI